MIAILNSIRVRLSVSNQICWSCEVCHHKLHPVAIVRFAITVDVIKVFFKGTYKRFN